MEQKTELTQRLERYLMYVFAKNKNHKINIEHLLRTAYWVKVLNPSADEALILAAIGHDIEEIMPKKDKSSQIRDVMQNRNHSEEGARIIADFLKLEGANMHTVEKVRKLISKHEIGGDSDEELIKEAGCISFLETITDEYLKGEVNIFGKEKTQERITEVFKRINSLKAKKIAEPFYKEALRRLQNVDS